MIAMPAVIAASRPIRKAFPFDMWHSREVGGNAGRGMLPVALLPRHVLAWYLESSRYLRVTGPSDTREVQTFPSSGYELLGD